MNKLKSFLFVTAMLVDVGANAQFSFGLKAGLNLSTITNTENTKMQFGYKAGPSVEYAFEPNMAVQSGLFLSSQRMKAKKTNFKTEANYLQLPVCFAYKIPIASNAKMYLNAGPYFAYGLFGKSDFGFDRKEDTFGGDNLENFDMGATFGAGAEVFKFNLGLNYDFGITEVWKDSKSRNSNFWFSVGYKF